MLRKTYAVVDLACIRHNITQLKQYAKTDVMAVVKADAYGHGMIAVAKTAQSIGVRWFGVATPDEAIALRNELPDANILVFSPVDEESTFALVENNISICAFSLAQLELAVKASKVFGKSARIHVKIDTGMNRVGLRTEAELQAVLDFFNREKALQFEGVFTHFALADSFDQRYAEEQLKKFVSLLTVIQKAGSSPIRHASNSAATIGLETAHLDMCRMGIAMYGYAPSLEMDMKNIHLQPALRLVSHITQIKQISAGDKVSYGCTYEASSNENILTVPIGYADGYRRGLSQKSWAFVNGQKAHIAGRVCMDQTMFSIGNATANIGDEVVLLGEGITADGLATLCDTISYEILTGISNRVPRTYINE